MPATRDGDLWHVHAFSGATLGFSSEGRRPAGDIELPSPRRPQARVWTDQRVRAWRETGGDVQVAAAVRCQFGPLPMLRFPVPMAAMT